MQRVALCICSCLLCFYGVETKALYRVFSWWCCVSVCCVVDSLTCFASCVQAVLKEMWCTSVCCVMDCNHLLCIVGRLY
jgi:hypothetical protein